MPRRSDARQRMIESAALLFRERGVHGTSFSDVLAHSGAPRGSVYHHFGGGKPQLAEEAIRWAGELVTAGTAATLRENDPVAAIGVFRRQWSRTLLATGFAAGCPMAAAVLDGEHEPGAREVAAQVLGDWQDVIAGALRDNGVPARRARSLATLMIAAIEGALVLARAERSLRPLERVTRELEDVVAAALA